MNEEKEKEMTKIINKYLYQEKNYIDIDGIQFKEFKGAIEMLWAYYCLVKTENKFIKEEQDEETIPKYKIREKIEKLKEELASPIGRADVIVFNEIKILENLLGG